MRNLTKNQGGFFLVSVAIVLVIVGSIGINVILNLGTQSILVRSRMRAYYDAEVAIDSLGQQLRQAYDMAAPVAESNDTSLFAPNVASPYTATYFKSVNGAPVTAVAVPVGFYIPGGKLCSQRGDTAFIAGSLFGDDEICVKLPDDFSVKNERLESGEKVAMIAVKPSLTDRGARETVYRPRVPARRPLMVVLESLIDKSFAQSSKVADPGPVAAAPATNDVSVVNYDPTAPAFRLRYGNNNCLPTQTDRFCVTIKLCIKMSGPCDATDPIVQQTFVMMKAPQSSLFD